MDFKVKAPPAHHASLNPDLKSNTSSASDASKLGLKARGWLAELKVHYSVENLPGKSEDQITALHQRLTGLINFALVACSRVCEEAIDMPGVIQSAADYMLENDACPPGAALYRQLSGLMQAHAHEHLTPQDKLYTLTWQ